jgi:hypothetical protein
MFMIWAPMVMLAAFAAGAAVAAGVAWTRGQPRAGSMLSLAGAFTLLLFFVLPAIHFEIATAGALMIWSGGALSGRMHAAAARTRRGPAIRRSRR